MRKFRWGAPVSDERAVVASVVFGVAGRARSRLVREWVGEGRVAGADDLRGREGDTRIISLRPALSRCVLREQQRRRPRHPGANVGRRPPRTAPPVLRVKVASETSHDCVNGALEYAVNRRKAQDVDRSSVCSRSCADASAVTVARGSIEAHLKLGSGAEQAAFCTAGSASSRFRVRSVFERGRVCPVVVSCRRSPRRRCRLRSRGRRRQR